MSKIIVAMSGGVDSSTTAFKLINEGHDVSGITLSMGRKCDEKSIYDAKRIADKLKIKHYVLDVSSQFNSNVIDYFISSYKSGKTPNPCGICNRFIKFNEIIKFVKNNNFDYMATGHYANIFLINDEYRLCKAKFLKKDQSYFLSTVNYEFLQYIKFPLGNELDKINVREEAKQFDDYISQKKDSQDVCFIETNYKDFLKSKNVEFKPGIIQHIDGSILGKHNGIINYTIGQRKGLGVSYKKPIFVVRFDVDNNIVYVSDNEEDLFYDKLYIKNVNLLTKTIENKEYTIKLRSTHSGDIGKFNLLDNNKAEIILNKKTRAITKGQLACLYDDDKVVASGWII